MVVQIMRLCFNQVSCKIYIIEATNDNAKRPYEVMDSITWIGNISVLKMGLNSFVLPFNTMNAMVRMIINGVEKPIIEVVPLNITDTSMAPKARAHANIRRAYFNEKIGNTSDLR